MVHSRSNIYPRSCGVVLDSEFCDFLRMTTTVPKSLMFSPAGIRSILVCALATPLLFFKTVWSQRRPDPPDVHSPEILISKLWHYRNTHEYSQHKPFTYKMAIIIHNFFFSSLMKDSCLLQGNPFKSSFILPCTLTNHS